jgi:Zn-dependent metalloprotease
MRPRSPSRIPRTLARAAAATIAAASLASVVPGAVGVAGSEPSRSEQAIAHARQNLQSHGREVRASGADGFVVKDVVLDADGSEHVRFDRTYRGLAVIGGDLVVHESDKGAFRGASLTLGRSLDGLDTTPTVSESSAVDIARGRFAGTIADASAQRLVVWARTDAPVLAREVLVTGTAPDGGPSELHVFVDAKTGAVVDQWDGIERAKPTASVPGVPMFSTGTPPVCGDDDTLSPADENDTGLYSTTVCVGSSQTASGYVLVDPKHGGQETVTFAGGTSTFSAVVDNDGAFGSSGDPHESLAAVDAQYGAEATWDYFVHWFGRSGIGNDGKPAQSRVHYDVNYNNAFWSDSCFCMTYGDGDGTKFTPLVSLDIAGHEMTHGVTSRTAGLTYSRESGGLNEATSDVFGAMVERSVEPGPTNYRVGEQVAIGFQGGALRFMRKPSDDGRSFDCWNRNVGLSDVHYSSGVGNHAFALLAEGSAANVTTGLEASPTCNGLDVVGVGADAAAAVWYRALTAYWTSNTNYSGARAGMIQAANELTAAGKVPTGTAGAVAAAWSAVGVK